MKPIVDQNKCIGCGTCVSLCPEVFELGEDGKSHPMVDDCEIYDCDCQNVVNSCPVRAVSLEEQKD